MVYPWISMPEAMKIEAQSQALLDGRMVRLSNE